MSAISAISYLNIEVVGAALTTSSAESTCYRDVSRSGAIVNEPDDYYVGISRALIPMNEVPLAVGVMDPLGINGLDLVDKLTLTFNNSVATVPVRLMKQIEEVNIIYPQPDGYTFIWTREALVDILNDALIRASQALNALVPGTITVIPYVSFNAESQLNTLTVFPLSLWDLTGTEVIGRANLVMLWLNQPATLQWYGFDYVAPRIPFVANPPQNIATMISYINIKNDGSNYIGAPNPSGSILPVTPAATALQFEQGYPNTGIIACQTIQIRSSLPVLPEFTDKVPNTIGSNPAGSTAILTDLRPDSTTSPNTFQMQSTYVESGLGQIRWLKLTGRVPITTFNISIYWTDLFLKARILQVYNQSCTIKLAFARRSLIDNWAFSYGEQAETIFNKTNSNTGSGAAGKACKY